MTTTWPNPARPGVPLNPERDMVHWLKRRNCSVPEAWRWDPDADGCGTEYSGAWEEAEGDGQPDSMAKWYEYIGPCLTPDEVAAMQARADRAALGHAHEAARADQSEFLRKRDVAALQTRVAELEGALQRIVSAGGLFAEPASGQHAREIARAALAGGKE